MKKIVSIILMLLILSIFNNCTPESLAKDDTTMPVEQTQQEQAFGVGADPNG